MCLLNVHLYKCIKHVVLFFFLFYKYYFNKAKAFLIRFMASTIFSSLVA